MMKQTTGAAQDFIEQLTPNEYAQIYPQIRLSVINVNNPKFQFSLPLAKPGQLRTASDYKINKGYYSTKTFGLTGLDMRLDGDDHPFFGKSYIVDFEFVFELFEDYLYNSTYPFQVFFAC